jgi:lipoate-protein ligase B
MNAQAVFLETPVPYGIMADVQNELLAQRIANTIPDTVLLLEHTPVVTLGRRGRKNHLLLSREALQQRGIALHHASRGGDVTYHGPGQLVLYPIIHLGDREADAHGYLHNLEETAIRTAADFGVKAYRRTGKSGAWTDAGKIAAIGFHLKRWVTSHGMSFNVAPDLTHFQTIVPCGLVGETVSSLQAVLGKNAPDLSEVRRIMAEHFADICQRPLTVKTLSLPTATQTATLITHIMDCIKA